MGYGSTASAVTLSFGAIQNTKLSIGRADFGVFFGSTMLDVMPSLVLFGHEK